MVRDPAIKSKLKVPSGKLDTNPLPFLQEALFGPIVWLQFCPVSILTDGCCEDLKSQLLSPPEAMFIAADPRGKKDSSLFQGPILQGLWMPPG